MTRRTALAVGWLAVTALAAPVAPVAEAPPVAQPEPPISRQDPVAPMEQGEEVDRPPPVAPAQEPASSVPRTSAAPASPEEPSTSPAAPAGATPAKASPAARDADRPIAVAAAPGSVTIKDFSFGPASVTVGVGESVTWRNDGPSGHTATAGDGSFDTGLLAAGGSRSITFDEAGSFSYLCTPHPFMKGTVRVVAQTSAGGESTGDTGVAAGRADAGNPQAGDPTLPDTGSSPAWLAITGIGLLLIGASGWRTTRADL